MFRATLSCGTDHTLIEPSQDPLSVWIHPPSTEQPHAETAKTWRRPQPRFPAGGMIRPVQQRPRLVSIHALAERATRANATITGPSLRCSCPLTRDQPFAVVHSAVPAAVPIDVPARERRVRLFPRRNPTRGFNPRPVRERPNGFTFIGTATYTFQSTLP